MKMEVSGSSWPNKEEVHRKNVVCHCFVYALSAILTKRSLFFRYIPMHFLKT
jgi:hypothetical protein